MPQRKRKIIYIVTKAGKLHQDIAASTSIQRAVASAEDHLTRGNPVMLERATFYDGSYIAPYCREGFISRLKSPRLASLNIELPEDMVTVRKVFAA